MQSTNFSFEIPPALLKDNDETSLQQLEFPKLLKKLQSHLSTPFGAEELASLTFLSDANAVQNSLDEVTEMMGLLDAGYYVPISGFSDPRPHLEKIKPENAYLEVEALLEIKSTLLLMGQLAHFFREHKEESEKLYNYGRGIHYHRNIIREIEGTIDPGQPGGIYDKASPELREIRIKIRSLEAEQTKALRRLQKRYAEYSQDEIVTLRDGRMVLGILPNFVNKVNGIVHGTSSSGATIFVEPMETLQISNQIQNLKIRERTEIIKILRFLTGLIRQVRNDIYYGIQNIAVLDFILAKARLARELNASSPKIINRPYVNISDARHPLLLLKTGQEAVVPLSLKLGGGFNTLLITGPNAGGKTVALKTVGLLIQMIRIGMPIPAGSDSEIPLLSNILVDIGDRQSLEQDLSTFSAHIVRLKGILEKADENSLALLDEIGTGTDPKEGSALAITILSELTKRNVLTIATTHHGELKAFAHRHSRVENGSMEFNLETLEPAYRLRLGIPGSSYAVEIARRYGLPEPLIQQARKYVGEAKDKLEDLILNLEERIQELEKKNSELSIKNTQAEAMRNLYQRQLDELKKNKADLKQQAAEEAQRILQEANALIERTVQEIRQTQASRAAIKSAKTLIREKKAEVEKALIVEEPSPADIPFLQKGDFVWVEPLGEEGELLEDSEGKNKVRVLVGNVKLTLDVSGLRKLDRRPSGGKVIRTMTGEKIDTLRERTGPELDLRGLDSQEAIEETDRYLDQAIEEGWDEVRIVHGKGTGILRQRINEFLSRDKRVEEKRLGKWGEGDTGVTVVKLREIAK
jgi:DNA mismatch repair protein MutS2